MKLTKVKVSFIKEGHNGGEFAKFKMLAIELPPEGRTIKINDVSGDVIHVEHDLSNNKAEVWISEE
ncbi:hypothetical protein [Christiangramia sp.]|uniref:hypothetical protein n=1 Tax=Christiangramia sp. TaxID=1931228 RepID=UPI002611A954|nr:hypothetical protein [Christiangramia sp.]